MTFQRREWKLKKKKSIIAIELKGEKKERKKSEFSFINNNRAARSLQKGIKWEEYA